MGAVGLALLFWPSPARAESLDLQWDAPEACPQAADIEDGVLQVLGPDFDPTTTALPVLSARVLPTQQKGWRLELFVQTPERTRRRIIEADSCLELSEAAVAVIALALDPSQRPDEPGPVPPAETSASEPSRVASSRHAAADDVPASPPSQASPEARGRLVVSTEAFLAFDTRVLPEPALGAGLGVFMGIAGVQLGLRGTYFAERPATVEGTTVGEIGMYAAGFSACYSWTAGRVMGGPCLAFEAGALPSQGSSKTGRWLASAVALRGLWLASDRVGLIAAVEGWVPWVHDEFVYRADSVFTVPSWTLRSIFGLHVQFQ